MKQNETKTEDANVGGRKPIEEIKCFQAMIASRRRGVDCNLVVRKADRDAESQGFRKRRRVVNNGRCSREMEGGFGRGVGVGR